MNVISPLTLDIVKKMEYNPWVIELWNNDHDLGSPSLVGLIKIDLNSVGEYLTSNVKFEKVSLYPVIVYDNPVPIETIRRKEVVG